MHCLFMRYCNIFYHQCVSLYCNTPSQAQACANCSVKISTHKYLEKYALSIHEVSMRYPQYRSAHTGTWKSMHCLSMWYCNIFCHCPFLRYFINSLLGCIVIHLPKHRHVLIAQYRLTHRCLEKYAWSIHEVL